MYSIHTTSFSDYYLYCRDILRMGAAASVYKDELLWRCNSNCRLVFTLQQAARNTTKRKEYGQIQKGANL